MTKFRELDMSQRKKHEELKKRCIASDSWLIPK